MPPRPPIPYGRFGAASTSKSTTTTNAYTNINANANPNPNAGASANPTTSSARTSYRGQTGGMKMDMNTNTPAATREGNIIRGRDGGDDDDDGDVEVQEEDEEVREEEDGGGEEGGEKGGEEEEGREGEMETEMEGDGEGGLYRGDARLTDLEASVLEEWVRLRGNLDVLSTHLSHLSANPSTSISDTLRLLERKTALVHTALKSSVYSIVLSAQEG